LIEETGREGRRFLDVGFGAPRSASYAWEHPYHRDAWLDQVPTSGLISRLPAAVTDRLIEETGAAIDALGGSFVMPYVTVVFTAPRP
jgi:hypothetical protein